MEEMGRRHFATLASLRHVTSLMHHFGIGATPFQSTKMCHIVNASLHQKRYFAEKASLRQKSVTLSKKCHFAKKHDSPKEILHQMAGPLINATFTCPDYKILEPIS